MDKNFKNITKQKRLGRKTKFNKVRIVPVFKKSLDINKLGNAFVLLAARMAEEKLASTKSNSEKTESSGKEKPDSGGSYEKIL